MLQRPGTTFAVLFATAILAAPAVRAQSPREGITVHGHWIIEVTNRDGTLADRREFDNGLVEGGAAVLSSLLRREVSLERLGIFLAGRANGLESAQADSSSPFSYSFFNATVTPRLDPNGVMIPGGNGVVLKATATADTDGTIKSVYTAVRYCQGRVLDGCADQAILRLFSGTIVKKDGIAQPVTLVKDQDVKVTVTFIFM